ncbi:MAG: hypothetical protein ABW049_06255 [Spongiibacteraceae bacterium]
MTLSKEATSRKKSEKAAENHDSIAIQTAAFLNSGGKIQQIQTGSSNYVYGAPKHTAKSK